MTHEELIQSLDSYLDGDLTGTARSEVEEHLVVCASCRDELKRTGRLLDEAATLRDRQIAPDRDLWPAIERCLQATTAKGEQRRPIRQLRLVWFPAAGWAMAAIVLIAAIWAVFSRQPRVSEEDLAEQQRPGEGESIQKVGGHGDSVPGRLPWGHVDLTAELSALDAEYGASLNLVLQAAGATHEADRGSSWAVFESNLSVLDDAIAESRRALESDPGDISLQRALLYTYQRQLDLLRWAQKVIGQT